MAVNLERDEFVYPSNSDDSDFEGTFRSSPSVASEIFDPLPAAQFSSDSETEILEENENNPNADEPNSYGFARNSQFTIIPVIMKMKISSMVGIDLFFGNNSFFSTLSMFHNMSVNINGYATQIIQRTHIFLLFLFYILSKEITNIFSDINLT